MKKALIFIFCTGLFIACKKDNNPINPTGNVPSSDTTVVVNFDQNDFPVKVGNWWLYRVIDSNYGTIDTLLVSVDSILDISEGRFHCTLTEHGAIVDSSVIVINSDSLVYDGLKSYYSYFGEFKLKFPFQKGDTWRGFFVEDTVRAVSQVDDFTYGGVTYPSIFNLKRSFFIENTYSLTQFIILAPGIGVVNQSIDLFDNGNVQSQNFSLIDYNLE